ncbi:glycosyltransferase family 10, partial [Alphaproteobacteria bacterium]|nr:glycosyltransferase family 10 [Alphaproteobacteria bacterium]
ALAGRLLISSPIDYLVILGTTNRSFDVPLPKDRIIFITSEPETVQHFPSSYLAQFGTVFYCQKGYEGSNRVDIAPLLPWFVGVDMSVEVEDRELLGFDYFDQLSFQEDDKQDRVSIIASATTVTEVHRLRFKFAQTLKDKLGDKADLYGRGYAPFGDKLDVLSPYKYHIALENFSTPHYWTEKILDAFLSDCHPFYFGCPNIEDYFPKTALSQIDIRKPEEAADFIEQAISENLWAKSKKARAESKEWILRKYNLPFFIAKYLSSQKASRQEGATKILPISACLSPIRRVRNSVRDWGAAYINNKPYKQAENRDSRVLLNFLNSKIGPRVHIGVRDGNLAWRIANHESDFQHLVYEPRLGFKNQVIALFEDSPNVSIFFDFEELLLELGKFELNLVFDCSLVDLNSLIESIPSNKCSTVTLTNLWTKQNSTNIKSLRNWLSKSHKKLKKKAYSYEIYQK